MYIPEFWVGVCATLSIEVVTIIVWAFICAKRGGKDARP